jgi:hypothetical protein
VSDSFQQKPQRIPHSSVVIDNRYLSLFDPGHGQSPQVRTKSPRQNQHSDLA